MEDYCLRVAAANGQIRAFVASSGHMVDKAAQVHNASAVAAAALGRALTAAAIMGLMADNDNDTITLNIRGDGALGGVLAVSDGQGRVRGYTHNPQVDVANRPDGKLNVGGAIGSGYLTIAKDIGLKEPYTGKIALVSGEIAEDLAHYFAVSEQTPTIISLGVLVNPNLTISHAGGLFLQLMPGFSDDLIDKLEEQIANFPSISQILSEGKTPEDIAEILLAPFKYEITEKMPIKFACNCDKPRIERALISLGYKEISDIITEIGKAEINCHFCNTNYIFNKEDLEGILHAIRGGEAGGVDT